MASSFVLEQAPWREGAVKRPCRAEKTGAAPTQNLTSFYRRCPLQTPSGECASSIPSLASDALSISDRLDMEQADGLQTSWSILSLRAPCMPCSGACLPRLRPRPDLLLPGVFRHGAAHDPEGGWPTLPERSPRTPTTRLEDGTLPGTKKKSDASPFPCAPLRCSTDIGAHHCVCGAGAAGWPDADDGMALPLLRLPMFRFRADRLSQRPCGAQTCRSACGYTTMRR